jgi:hypothetical protein
VRLRRPRQETARIPSAPLPAVSGGGAFVRPYPRNSSGAEASEVTDGGHLYEDGKHIGHIENGFAFDRRGEKRYQVDHPKLRDIKTGEVVGYLNAVGLPGTVTKKGLFD